MNSTKNFRRMRRNRAASALVRAAQLPARVRRFWDLAIQEALKFFGLTEEAAIRLIRQSRFMISFGGFDPWHFLNSTRSP
jgi:hypothetical protein